MMAETMGERFRDWWYHAAPYFARGVAFAGICGMFALVLMSWWKWMEFEKPVEIIRAEQDAKIEWCIAKWGGTAEIDRNQRFASCTVPARIK